MSLAAVLPTTITNMNSRPTPTPVQPVDMKHHKSVAGLKPAMVTVPRMSRRRCSAKVPVTISHSFVSLGWWMVMSDDEQGYAPAAYLEPVEGGGRAAVEQAMDGTESLEGEYSSTYIYKVRTSTYNTRI